MTLSKKYLELKSYIKQRREELTRGFSKKTHDVCIKYTLFPFSEHCFILGSSPKIKQEAVSESQVSNCWPHKRKRDRFALRDPLMQEIFYERFPGTLLVELGVVPQVFVELPQIGQLFGGHCLHAASGMLVQDAGDHVRNVIAPFCFCLHRNERILDNG